MDSDQAKKTEKKQKSPRSEIVELHPTKPDITEHKKAEEAVRRSKQQWETTFNAMSDWVILIDLKSRIIRTNRAGENFTGKPLTEIIGQSCCKLVHGQDKQIPGCPLTKMLQTGQQVSAEFQVPGTDRWLMVTVDPVTNSKGNIVGAVHVTRDITDRKKAEKTIRDSEARYKYLFEQSPLGIGLATPDGRVVHVNKTMEVITGYFREELKKINLADIYENPQDRKKLLETIERYGCAVDFATRLKRKDGTVYDALLNVSRVRFDDQDFFQTICMDITERKRAEEALQESEAKLRRAQEVAHVGSWYLDLRTNRLVWSDETYRIFGVPIGQPLMEADFLVIVYPDDISFVRQSWDAALHGGPYDIEHRIVVAGTVKWVREKAELEFDAEGKPLSGIGTVQDITERKKTEAALRESEGRYRAVFERTNNPIMVIDTKGNYIHCNDAGLQFVQCTRDELLKKNVQDFVPPGKEQDVLEGHKPLWESGGTVETEYYVKGKVKILELTITPGIWGGKPVVFGVGKDITDRKRAQEDLHKAEAELQHTIEVVPGIIAKANVHTGYLTHCNPAMSSILGFSSEELLAQPFIEFVHPDDRQRTINEVEKQLKGSPVARFENRYICKDASYKWLEWRATAADEKGIVYAAATDITERKNAEIELKNSEARLSEAESIAHIGYLDLDLSTNKIVWSPETFRIYGFNPKDFEPTLENTVKLVHPDDLEFVQKNLDMAMKGEKEYDIEHRNIRADGKVIHLHAKARLICDQQGKPIRLIGTVNDITERKKTDEQIEKLARFPAENPNPVLRISKDCTILYANRASSVVLETWGKKVGERLPQDCCKHVEEALSSGKVSTFEFTCHDGRIFKATLAPVVESGYVNVYGLDITENRQAMEQIEKLARFPAEDPNPVLRVSGYGTVIYGNKASVPLLKVWQCRVGESLPAEWYDVILDALSSGDSQQTEVKYDGRTFSLTFAPVTDANYVNVYGLDITERKRAEKRLLDYQEQLKSLASQMTLTEEQERRRIATDLHDNITQSLAMSKLKLDLVRDSKSSSSADLVEVLNETSRNIEHIIQEVRTLTFDLSSPILYELGFEAAVAEWLTVRIEKEHGIATEFEDDGQPKPLDDDTRTVLFRDVRELLTNVVKHAQAKKVKVSIRKVGSRIHVSVEDDGRGFDPEKTAAAAAKAGEFGLFSIRERLKQLGGNIEIESGSGHGTRVTLTAPLKSES